MHAQSLVIESSDIQQHKLVTLRVGQQLFGIPVQHVRDVLKGGRITSVPLAMPEISGLMNLRGRIVTVIDMRCRLKLPATISPRLPTFIVVEHKGEFYSLQVDSVGDVLAITSDTIEKPPSNLAGDWREISSGVHRLENELLVIIHIPALLTFLPETKEG